MKTSNRLGNIFKPEADSYFGRSRLLIALSVVLLFGLGLGLRLLDLTEPPLDYHPIRQLRAAIIARGMYYEILPSADPELRQTAVELWRTHEWIEPQLFERVVAWTYLVAGGEHLWLARLYAVLFWMIGGAALFLLAHRISSFDGALVAGGFYFLLPFGVYGSRAFLPDIPMLMFVLLAAYTLYRWSEARTWKWAIPTGVFAGAAILIKMPAILPLSLMAVAIFLAVPDKRLIFAERSTWAMGGVSAIPFVIFYFFINPGATGGKLAESLSQYMPMLLDPSFYSRWLLNVHRWIDLTLVTLSLAGAIMLPAQGRAIVFGLLGGYGLLGLAFPYHINTHDYYSLPLLPAVALGLAPVGQAIFTRVRQQAWGWQLLFAGLVFFAAGFPAFITRGAVLGSNYHLEPAGWARMAANLPQDGYVIGLVQDYGFRIQYYGWRHLTAWPDGEGRLANFDQVFDERTRGRRYFLVSMLGSLEAQPDLKEKLYNHYPVFLDMGSYVIFDLEGQVGTAP